MGIIDGRKITDMFLQMNISTWAALLVAVITLATPGGATEARVVCYYTNWSVYRPGTARFNPQNINPYLCTHLIYAFGGFTKDNTLKPFDKYQDIEKGGYAKFTGLKTYNKELKTMLAIGGWNEGSTRFSPMVASRERRKEFVRNAIKFLRQNKFDGLDLDWEYPAFRDGGKPKDRENYAKLVKELREEFEKESEKTGRQRLLLTMAVPAGIEYIQKGFDVKTLNQYLDWMNLLTYDYHSAFEPAVNHHAPLYPLEEPNEYSVDNELNIDYTIKFYIENGADRDKLVLGIPTYGRSYTLFNADAVEIGSPADGPGEQGDATREKGYLAYYEICEALKPKEKKQTTPSSDEDSSEDTEEEDQPWTLLQPNPNAMGPVAYKGNQWVGYDDVDIVRKKAEYVADNGLGGIMFWSIDNDDFRGNCHDKPYPLIEAAKEAYIVGLGSTKNAVVTDRPRATTTRASARRKTKPRATTPRPTTERTTRKSAISSTTPSWNANTPEPPTTPDPGSDFKCTDEGFFQHPRDCKKYFWCLDSGPSNLGIVAHQFTCPSGLFFNKAADSCDFSRNVLCKMPSATTKAPTTKTTTTKAPVTTTTTTRRPIKLSTKSSVLFRTTTTTTPEPEVEEEYEEQFPEDPADIEAQDPKVLKELIDLIKKVGGVEQLEKQLHLDTPSASQAPGTATTTRSFNKQLYKKVLERTKKAKLNIPENSSQYSRRGPQNAGLEPAADKDRLLRKDRPQYTSIRRARPSTTADPLEEEIEEESAEVQQVQKARAVEVEAKVGTTTKPLQYVNIRRARPTSDTADDTASRNALFERPESFVSVTEPNSLDVSGARREHMPEYVTIRRQRPTTEEATTVQYSSETEGEERGTALEREISSPQQPQYISIVRSRPSTTLPPEEVSSPEPTTVLAVQISSLLNDPVDNAEITVADEKEDETTTSTTTTTTTTASPSSIPPRRIVQRRRGSTTTTTTTSTVAPASQVSSRNYTFVRRRRPIATPNEIVSDVDDNDSSRKIRSTTPNSREINEIKPREPGLARRNRFRLQTAKPEEDSVPAAASPVSRGQFRPQLSRDEVLSLTPLDAETPQFVQKPSFTPKVDRRFRSRTATTVADVIQDSEASAATVEASEARRPTFGTRGRGRFTPSSTTTAEPTLSTEAKPIAKRPTFARISPRPFGRPSTTIDEDEEENIEPVTQRLPARLPFGRSRPSSSTPTVIQARRLPFSSRISTTRQPLGDENKDTVEEEEEERHDDITLSESAIAEKEHEENEEVVSEQPKRRIIVKKLRAPVSSTTESPATTEAITDENGRKKIRVIRRRPTSTTETLEDSSVSTEPTPSSTPTRIRKIIRKKIKPVEVEDEPNIIAKSINSLNTALKDSTTEVVVNYGEKSRPFSGSTAAPTETETKPDNIVEEINAMKEESKSQAPEEPQKEPTEIEAPPPTEELLPPKEDPQTPTESTPDVESDSKPEVVVESEQKAIDLSKNKEELSTEVSEEPKPETTTTTTTQAPSSTSRARGPYRPLKRIFTSTTESVPSSSRTFSRKYNPGAYTSPSTVEKTLDKAVSVSTRRTFTARTFTRRPFTTARTTKKAEEEYDDSEEEIEEEEEEPEEENPIVLVPQNQLFSRRPTADEETEENEEEEVPQNRFTPSSRKPSFKPRVVNSNTFRTSTTTTELPKRLGPNRTAIFNRFGGAKPANGAKKRVQNVPIGYGKPSEKPNETLEPEKEEEVITTTNDSTDEFTTTEDDYLSGTEASTESSGTTPEEATSTNTVDSETATFSMDFDNSTDDFLDFSDSTTNYPSTQDSTSDGNTGPVDNISFISTSPYPEYHESTTTEADTEPTTSAQQVTPVVKTQFNKLFSISRSVEVSSKLDKHRLNKHNETKLIEEGKVMVETKPRVDKIGEVSRYSLIKIVEDEIPIYLTKLGHVYPVENPPDNLIRIDEARNARALVNFADAPRENLIASESMNEAYRHVSNQVMNLPKDDTTDKGVIEHLIGDDFLSYVNEDTSKKNEKTDSYVDEQTYQPQWQFVPAAYENERNREGKSYDIITPRSAFTEPSTLPLEGLFKTDTPLRARKVGDGQQPFVVYSASLPNQKEEGNIVKLSVIKPEAGRSIITFAKGQEFNGASVTEEATVKYPVNIAVLSETEATPPATTVIEELRTSPLIEMLTTPTTLSTESPTIVTTGAPTTTEAITEETTTTKSVFDTKRSKFAFPRRPAIKPANLSRLSAPRAATKKNATTNGNLPQKTIAKGNLPPKVNKTSSYSSSKSRFTANRGQNVPVDIRKKTAKLPLKSVTTETPRTTTEKRLLYKSIRPIRPAFVPRRSTTPPPTEAGDT